MKTFNVIVFSLLAVLLLAGAMEFTTSMFWDGEFWVSLLVMLGLLLVPGTFLLVWLVEEGGLRRPAVARRFAAGYGGAAALLLAWYGITADAVTNPIAKVWSLIIAVLAAMNAVRLLMPKEIASRAAKSSSDANPK